MAVKANDDYVGLFWSNVEVKDGHWIWKGSKAKYKDGYKVGTIRVGRDSEGFSVTQQVDRWSYEYYNEEKVPKGKIVRPSCGEPMCVHPNCLKVVDVEGRDKVQFSIGNQVKKLWWDRQRIDKGVEPGRSIRNGK